MANIFDQLKTSGVLTDDTIKQVKEAFDSEIENAKVEIEASIREDYSKRYEEDKNKMAELAEQWIDQIVEPHLTELSEGIDQVNAFKMKLSQARTNLEENASEQVAAEIARVDEYIQEQVDTHIKGLYEQVQDMNKAYAKQKAMLESKAVQEREQLKEKAAAVIDDIINVQIDSLLSGLEKEIRESEKKQFGMEMFEAFRNTFLLQFFDSNAEIKKVMESYKKLEESFEDHKAKSQEQIAEAQKAASEANGKYEKVMEAVSRSKIMKKVMEGLNETQRKTIAPLLEGVRTEKLEETATRYKKNMLKEATNPKARKSKKIEEAAFELRTGSPRVTVSESQDNDFDDEIAEIQIRSGQRQR